MQGEKMTLHARMYFTVFSYICMYVCAAFILFVYTSYRLASRYSHVLQGRNHAQIQSKWRIVMLLLDQNFTLFQMVHLVFLEVVP
jgi:hypothetical protein